MKENKLSHIGIAFSSNIVGTKVWDCLLEIIAQNIEKQYWEFRQSQVNRQSIHDRIEYQRNDVDQRLKNRSIHDWLGKQVVDQNCADYEEEDDEEYVW